MRILTKLKYLGMMWLLALLAIGQAHAQATRTWISGVGDDANPCSRTAPCKTFAGAISKTATSGVIDVLDPGGFGAVTITKSITLENVGAIGGVLVSGTNGINVSGVGAVVTLRGMSFEGLGTGLAGVNFTQGSQLIVERCDIDAFSAGSAVGINFAPSTAATLIVRDSTVHKNGVATSVDTTGGILIKPTAGGSANVVLDNVRLVNNSGFGLQVNGPASVVVRDSVFGGNLGNGISISGATGTVTLTLDNANVNSNGETGLLAQGPSAQIQVSHSVITGNATGMQSSGGGAVVSFGDNLNSGNTVNGAPDSSVAQE